MESPGAFDWFADALCCFDMLALPPPLFPPFDGDVFKLFNFVIYVVQATLTGDSLLDVKGNTILGDTDDSDTVKMNAALTVDGNTQLGDSDAQDTVTITATTTILTGNSAFEVKGNTILGDTDVSDTVKMNAALTVDGHTILGDETTDQLTVGATSTFNACLLYTSPSPRDQRGSRMPSSA